MITGNEPAMPIWFEGNLGQMNSTGGLTIRQEFAKCFLAAILSRAESFSIHPALFYNEAQLAVAATDQLINELNKQL